MTTIWWLYCRSIRNYVSEFWSTNKDLTLTILTKYDFRQTRTTACHWYRDYMRRKKTIKWSDIVGQRFVGIMRKRRSLWLRLCWNDLLMFTKIIQTVSKIYASKCSGAFLVLTIWGRGTFCSGTKIEYFCDSCPVVMSPDQQQSPPGPWFNINMSSSLVDIRRS